MKICIGGSDGKESTCDEGDLVQSLGWKDPLEMGMATQSSTLAWEIPWTEESGGLQPMASQSPGHNRETNIFTLMLNFQGRQNGT